MISGLIDSKGKVVLDELKTKTQFSNDSGIQAIW